MEISAKSFDPSWRKAMSDDNNVFESACLLNLTVGMPGNSKRVNNASVLHEDDGNKVDHNWISVSKRLLDSKEFDNIKRVVGQWKRYLERKCIVARGGAGADKPALRRFLKSGVYVLPLGLVAEVDKQINQYKGEFDEAVEAFLEVYPRLRDEAKDKLRELFDVQDYPPPEALKRAFYADVAYLNVSTPKALENISADIFKREQEQAKRQWAEASQEIKQVLRTGFQGLVDFMVDALKPPGSGEKQKQFRGATVSRITEFLEDFGSKNIVNDDELAALVEQAKGLLEGQDVESIQKAAKDEDWRSDMADKFSKIKEELDPLVGEVLERRILIED
jgi:hypothetical protein